MELLLNVNQRLCINEEPMLTLDKRNPDLPVRDSAYHYTLASITTKKDRKMKQIQEKLRRNGQNQERRFKLKGIAVLSNLIFSCKRCEERFSLDG